MAMPLLMTLVLMTWPGAMTSWSLSQWMSTPCGPCQCCESGLTVDCSSRSLTAVPDTRLLPATATTLLLHNNSIPLLQPSAFQALPSLRNLDLSLNLLANVSANVFEGLGGLLSLNLSHNQLTMDVLDPSDMPFVFLTSLERVDLGHNLLSDVSHKRGLSAGSLRWLDLSHNRIRSSEVSSMLHALHTLTFLDLSHNLLHSVQGLFRGLNSLQALGLSGNQIPLSDSLYPAHVFEPFQFTLTQLALEGNCKVPDHCTNYPDQALSRLSNLEFLRIDGLPGVAFGPGFGDMTSLVDLSLSGLDGGHCSMHTLSNDTFLSMPASLRQMNLSGCAIVHIEMDAFGPLGNIDVLDLSHNVDLGFDTLGDAFYSLQESALRMLRINAIIRPYSTCVLVTPHNTRYFTNTSLQAIHARDNRLEIFCEGALSNMPRSLQFVDVSGNALSFGAYLKDLGSLKNLTVIHNDGSRFVLPSEFPRHHPRQCQSRPSVVSNHQNQCQQSWRSDNLEEVVRIPAMEDHLREENSSENNLVFTLPPNLEEYASRLNRLYYRVQELDIHPNNSLKILNLNSNLITTWIGPLTGLNHLVSLDLGNNFVHRVSLTFFDTLTSLKSLNASRNELRIFIEEDVHGRWFQPLSQLEKLYLSKNYINVIPRQFFKGLVSLQTLVLSQNEMFIFDVNITMMWNISLLNLSKNNIHFLPQFIMDHLDHVALTTGHNVTVDMTFNAIACTCEHIDFLNWIQTSPVDFPKGNKYSCRMSDGSIQDYADIFHVIRQLQDTCTDNFGILVGAVSCFICLMMVLAAAVAYRYRWKLRYLYFASRLHYSRLDWRRRENDDNDDFLYDAFVSYSSEDGDFVHGRLQEELETGAGLRLNIHNRDFTPGRPIPSNIVDSVQKSRHTLVVLTPALVTSDWCHYEMQMATVEAAYSGRDVLLFLLYRDVASHQLPRDLFYNLQASTYIAFPSPPADPARMRDFWARLVQAIRH